MTQTELMAEGASTRARPARPVVLVVIGALVVVLVVALAAYEVGRARGNQVRVLTGNAYVGDHVASVRINGWSYGIEGTVDWVDRAGTAHDSGWPACLSPIGATVRIRFGEIAVTGPQHDWWREVVWVDCRRAVRVS